MARHLRYLTGPVQASIRMGRNMERQMATAAIRVNMARTRRASLVKVSIRTFDNTHPGAACGIRRRGADYPRATILLI